VSCLASAAQEEVEELKVQELKKKWLVASKEENGK
jgi:hypothetical protein